MDFTRAETTLRDAVAPVVEELQRTGADIADLMLLGAVCRDVLHQAAGHRSTLRRTGDLDLAIAVSSWESYDAITSGLMRVRNGTNIRFLVAGTPVDLVPFGEVESPDGRVPRQPPEGPMN